ncbi:MAG: succinylglutamate desuccinylase/aspartoacylase family protein [Acidimicrobiales bacterium]
MARRTPLTIGGIDVAAGRRARVELPVSKLVTGAQMSIPVVAIHGKTSGPNVWVNAALHGDEINGVEIINRVLADVDPKTMAGTLIAVPVVNVHGFVTGDRYLPDRRDLNRSFPGSKSGSLASRLAHIFMTEIVDRCDVGIDLHTASDHRTNLPQIRANLDDAGTVELAEVFGASVMMHSKSRSGSLRGSATKIGKTVLLYEGGEALRFDQSAIAAGEAGVRRVLAHLGMIDGAPESIEPRRVSRSSGWVRATRSGIVHLDIETGDAVEKRQSLGIVADAMGKRLSTVRATRTGLVVGRTLYPMANKGDALVHVATLDE